MANNQKPKNTTPAAGTAPAADTPRKAGAPKAEDRVAPIILAARKDIPIPQNAKRGNRSIYADLFASLTEKGMSFGFSNKTKEQISSIVSKANRAEGNMVQKRDAAGNLVTKPGPTLKDAAGNDTGVPGTPVPVMVPVVEYQAFDTDPKKDPEGATVRVFRMN